MGSIEVLQTAGRSGRFNSHPHILCTSGGMTSDGRWEGFGYIDFKLLHKKWQDYFLTMMREHAQSDEMKKDIDTCCGISKFLAMPMA